MVGIGCLFGITGSLGRTPITLPIVPCFVTPYFLLGKQGYGKHSLDSRAMLHLRYDLLEFPQQSDSGFGPTNEKKTSQACCGQCVCGDLHLLGPPKEVTSSSRHEPKGLGMLGT